ncbi:flavin-containing monooxygenase [Microbacterium sp. No. 7]|uniref:flavin-containing monooxygenase n=1 Tax=Microbacterium sp. No. 7 TaxID=1714373 RepID=UPI0006D2CA78|nr:NAD(P)/FAD-dependent oxidoreductase [Microbacterium sp. No. 7]ALJ18873.1 cyclohexanone monooxygenase [Microbacterium sp. No. 7]
MTATHTPHAVDAVVVGAGFSGLYMTHRLRGLGMSIQGFEGADDVGGTWYWNRYPGARCDVESLDYSYSFSPELEQEWVWSERYAAQAEILRYLEHVADRFDLRRSYRFSTRVVAAHWDDRARRWRVRDDRGEDWTARYLVMATGTLSVPLEPAIEGIDDFEGTVLQTGRWPHEPVDVRGRRVVVVGTGSSAVQVIPELAAEAASLTVLQRTPNYVLPARNRLLTAEELAAEKAAYAERRDLAHRSPTGQPGPTPTRNAVDVDERERREAFERGWQVGGVGMSRIFADTQRDDVANGYLADFIREKIRAAVDDPEVARLLSPVTYPFGGKRPCVGTGYYETFNRDNVRLVDLRSDPIVRLRPGGVELASGEVPADVLVLATGFDAFSGPLAAIDLRGRDGVPLTAHWSAGPTAYLGIAVSGFPNMFVLTGPGSPSVLSNMVHSIEQHVDWLAELLRRAERDGIAEIEARAEAEDAWARQIDEIGAHTMFARTDNWYLGSNVPGKPRRFVMFAAGTDRYRGICDDEAAAGYPGFVLRDPAGSAASPRESVATG